MAENVTLLDLSFNTDGAIEGLDALISKSIELAEKKDQLRKALKEEQTQLEAAKKSYKDGTTSQADYSAAVDKAAKASIELKKQMLDVTAEIKDNNSEIKVNKTLLDSQATSVNALRAQLAKNTSELNAMSAAQRENSDEGQKMVAETKAISDRLKEMEKGVGDTRRNVGNYADSLSEALATTKGMSGATGVLVSSLSGGIGIVKAFNAALKANPVLAIVGFVMLLIDIVEKMMKRNSELANSLKAAFAPYKVMFGLLMDYITEFMGAVAAAITWVSDVITGLLDSLGLISDATKKAAKDAKALTEQEYALYQAETDMIVPLAERKRKMEELKSIGADQLKTEQERKAALQEAIEISKQMEAQEVGILKQKYEQIKAQNQLGYTSQEDARKEQEALAALAQKQAEYTSQRKEVIGQISGLEKTFRDKGIAEAKAAQDKANNDRIRAEARVQEEIKKKQEQALQTMEQNIVAVDLAAREAEILDKSLATKIANQEKYNDESLKLEKYRLEQGLITKQEYDNKALEMDITLREMREEQRQANEEADKQRAAVDMANQQELQAMEMTNEFDFRQMMLDTQYAQEMENAERIGADTALITEKYEKYKEDLARQRINATLEMSSSLAGQMSSLLGEESAAGKAFALVQATINTYLGASKALATGGFAGIAQAAIVIAFGLKQVATIAKTKNPDTKINSSVKKFAQGGQVYGKLHSQGGVTFTGDNGQVFEAEGGENVYIMKRTASADIAALSAINEAHGGKSFSNSGMFKYAEGGQVSTLSVTNAQLQTSANISDESISKLAGVVIEAIMSMPNPVVTVQDIDRGQNNVQVVQNSALL